MQLFTILKGLLSTKKKIELETLPSCGVFYNEDFEIHIRRATMDEIVDYEVNLNIQNFYSVLESIKKIVRDCTSYSKNYTYEDLKSIDVVWIFMEIVKYTNNSPITIDYFDKSEEKIKNIEVSVENFNYFKYQKYLNKYNKEERCFEINGYKFTLPTSGVENSLTKFLSENSNNSKYKKYLDYDYSFIYFLGQRNKLDSDEIKNISHIFNEEMDRYESEKVANIIQQFSKWPRYTFKVGKKVYEITSKIDLKNIFRK